MDPKGTGTIEALAAAKFLKKSGLSDVVLSRVSLVLRKQINLQNEKTWNKKNQSQQFPQIWDLSDPTGKGYLDKSGLFVALKLVALAQSGDTINMSNIFNELPNPPKVVSISVFQLLEKIISKKSA